MNELNKNLIDKNVFDMLEPKSVTYEMMKMSLGYLMFLKRKRCGKVKARGCADEDPNENTLQNLSPAHLQLRLMHFSLAVW